MNYENFKPHGIMIHNIIPNNTCEKKRKGYGITQNELESIIVKLKKRIINAKNFIDKSINNTLNCKDICITFDDLLKCQIELALPILNKYNIKAFFFINTCPLNSIPDKLEEIKYFRFNYFKSIDDFYNEFYDVLLNSKYKNKILTELENYNKNKYSNNLNKTNHNFYSSKDLEYRYIRDNILLEEEYYGLIKILYKKYNFDIKEHFSKIWMNKTDIIKLDNQGHIIGGHVHSHSIQYGAGRKTQNLNLKKNLDIIKNILNKNIHYVSWPSDHKTIKKDYKDEIEKNKIILAFRLTFNVKENFDILFIDRYDIANIRNLLLTNTK